MVMYVPFFSYEAVKTLVPLPRRLFLSIQQFLQLATIFFFPAVLNPSIETYRSPLQDRHGKRRSSHQAIQVPTHTVLPAPAKFESTSALQQVRIAHCSQ